MIKYMFYNDFDTANCKIDQNANRKQGIDYVRTIR